MDIVLYPHEPLVQRLPLPLAQLYRHAHNAKTPLERHNAAFSLWEAALKLLGIVAVAEFAALENYDPKIAERLQNLARPSLGHWWELVRRLVPVLADAQVGDFEKVRTGVLGRARNDLPHAAGLDAVLRSVLEQRTGGQRTVVRLTELFDLLVRYRNRESHGAPGQSSAAFYERTGRALLAGVAEILARVDVLAGRRLQYVSEVNRLGSGAWRVERYELTGESAKKMPSIELSASEVQQLPRPGYLYLQIQSSVAPPSDGPGWRLLYPLLVYDADSGSVAFWNARRGEHRIEYLRYRPPGHLVENKRLGTELEELLVPVTEPGAGDPELAEDIALNRAEESTDAESNAPAAGRTLGEFELLSRIGRGAMGVVYRAWQPSLGRQVALKCLLEVGNEMTEVRFNREIHSLGRIEHPHVIKVFTADSDGERWFYAMELIEGADLARVFQVIASRSSSNVEKSDWQHAVTTACSEARSSEKSLSQVRSTSSGYPSSDASGAMPRPVKPQPIATGSHPLPEDPSYVDHVADIIRQAVEGAHALHEAGVVHRDIKPGNIMLKSDGGHAVLMDLGLAQLADAVEGQATRTRQFVGTLRYASPEQVLAVDRVDRRSDVYSLGATLWELLTLRPLFGATDETPTPQLMLSIQHKEPERISKYNPAVPPDLEAIVFKCLEKDPARRYATAAELAEDLARWQRKEPVAAHRQTPVYRLSKFARRRRRTLVRVAAGLACVAAAVAVGVYGWVWPYDTYHADFVFRNRIPEGFGSLTGEQASHRSVSYRVTKEGRWGPVTAVATVDGWGKLVDGIGEIIGDPEDPDKQFAIAEFKPDREIAKNASRQILWQFKYDDAKLTGIYISPSGTTLFLGPSDASRVEFDRDPNNGFDVALCYTDASGDPRPNHDGTYGSNFEYHPNGLVKQQTYIDGNRKPTESKDGFATATYEYDPNTWLAKVSYLDAKGQPAINRRQGAAGWRCTNYDSNGNCKEQEFFGVDGKVTSRRIARYGDHGELLAMSFRDGNNDPVLDADGIAGWNSEYTDGNETERTYFDILDEPTLHKDGNAGWKATYKQGQQTKVTYFDLGGEQIAGWKSEYKYGNETKRTFLGVGDKRPENTEWQLSYDKHGQLTEKTYFYSNISDGIARRTEKFDDRGKVTEVAFYDTNGKRVLNSENVAGWRSKYKGNNEKRTFFGLDETSPARHKDGYAGWTAEYNELGLKRKVSYTDLDGQSPARHKDGYTGWVVAEYDKHRQPRKKTHFGFDPAGGYTQITKEFDDRGRVIKQTYEDTNGKLVLNSDEVAGWRSDYDGRGNETKRTYLGVDEKPTQHKDGYIQQVTEYTEQGAIRKRELSGYDASRGYTRRVLSIVEISDQGGTIAEGSHLNTAGERVLNGDGFAGWRSYYDKRGNETKLEFFGVDRRSTEHKDGYAGWKSEFDEHGRETKRSYFDLGGDDRKLVLDSKEGIAGWESEYKNGKESRRSFFGTDGKPTRNKEGYAGWKAEYDERESRTKMTLFGLDGEPVLNSDKIAGWSSHYENGNETERIYLGLDGKPTTNKDGYAKKIGVYDRGQLTEVRYFDVDGKPLRGKFVRIELVLPGSQAEAVGLLPGDIVTKYNGMSGDTFQLTNERDRIAKFGDRIKKIEMQILREGREIKTVELVPGQIGVQWTDSLGDSPSLFGEASAKSPGEKQQ